MDDYTTDAGAAPPEEAGPESAQPGTLFAERYRIVREIARGGMGRVLLAEDQRLGRAVAIKFLVGAHHEAAALLRFKQEARAAGALQHPNILAVYDAGDEAGQPYIIEEFLEGVTLRERLARGPLGPAEALSVALQFARGMHAAHEKGVVHRDLKPENLFLTNNGFLKILDFGIARVLSTPAPGGGTPSESGDTQPAITRAGQVVGTAGYMSPEQIQGGPVDARSDIFSFGVVLYELLSGKRAFWRPSPLQTAYAIVNHDPEPLPEAVPPALTRILDSCLRKSAGDRYPNAQQLVQALQAAQTGTPPDTNRAPLFGRVPPPRTLTWRLLLSLGAIGVAFALAVRLFGVPGLVRADLHPQKPPFQQPLVAVLPFAVLGSPQLAYLGEGLVDLLGADLAQGQVRTVDAHAVVRGATREAGRIEPARGAELARRFDATHFILGSVVEAEGRVSLHASLYALAQAAPLQEANATGPIADLFKLVAEVTRALRPALRVPDDPTGPAGHLGRLAATLTSSPEALKAYLLGEAALRRDSFGAALESFKKAVDLDPEFALGFYRLGVAASLREPGLSGDALARAQRKASRLPEREKRLLDAFLSFNAGRAAEAEQRYRDAVQAHGDDLEAWYQLGEVLYHLNPARGRSAGESLEPFERVLRLDPDHGGALDHLIDLALLGGQKDLASSLCARFLALGVQGQDSLALPVRWTKAWADGDSAARAAVLAELRGPRATWLDRFRVAVRAYWQQDDLADVELLAGILLETRVPSEQASGHAFGAVVDLARGRRRAAREELRKAAALAPGSSHRYDDLWTSTLDFLPMGRAELLADRAAAAQLDVSSDTHLALVRPWLSGALSVRLGDPAGVAAAVAAVGAQQRPDLGSATADLALGLQARLAYATGDRSAAQLLLHQMRLELPYGSVHLFAHASEQLLRLRLASGAADAPEAARLADAWAYYGKWEPVYFAPTALERARQYDQRGDRELAAKSYARYLELRKNAEPELQAEVRSARERLAALRPPQPAK